MCKKSICLTRFTAILLLAVLSLFTVFGCKNNSEDEGGNETDDGVFNPYPYEDLSIYMDLPDYKNITVEKHLVEKSVAAELSYFFNEHGLYINITDGKAEHFDLVNISYVGFIDGETFEGGTSMSTDLLLGSETYIEGFEDGIIGMNAGEAKNLSLKFPDDYAYTEYAGKDVIFTVTVNKISRAPELTDETVKEYTPFETADEYLAVLRRNCVFGIAFEKLMAQCTLKGYPNEYTEYYQYFKQYFTGLASQNGASLEEFIYYQGGNYAAYGLFSQMSLSDFERVASDYARSNTVNDLLTYSILRAENITLDGERFTQAKAVFEKESGASFEEISEKAGQEAAIISVLNIILSEIITSHVTEV